MWLEMDSEMGLLLDCIMGVGLAGMVIVVLAGALLLRVVWRSRP
jgi:hypothetical protein